MRLVCTLILVLFSCSCFAQQDRKVRPDLRGNGILVTQIIAAGQEESDTNQLLYVSNHVGDSLALYSISAGVVQSSLIHVKPFTGGVCLVIGQSDSLTIRFSDSEKEVRVNKDTYKLYPHYYQQFKQAVLTNHSVIATLRLLEDQIGDYPIENLLPLLQFATPANETMIRNAKIETRRSQADDVKDTWYCTYQYDKSSKLRSVIAAAGKVIRFKKIISYNGNEASAIKLYRNIEERQILNRTIAYASNNKLLVKWQDVVLETGKNRQTILNTTLQKKITGSVKHVIMQPAEVLGYIKKFAALK